VKIKVGQTVEVYEDPLTCKRKEGNAKVIEVRKEYGNGLVECVVRFPEGDFVRVINTKRAEV